MRRPRENYWFVLKNIFRFSPVKVFGDIFLKSAQFLLESFSALWLLYRVVAVIENGGSFGEALWWILGITLAYAFYFVCSALYNCLVKDCCDLDVSRGFESLLFEKTARLRMTSFDDPAFYAEYNKAVYCVQRAVPQVFAGIVNLAAFGLMLVNTVVFLCMLDPWLLLFSALAAGAWFMGKRYSRLKAQCQNEILEQERRKGYVRRVYLDRKYAQEVRTSHVGSKLNEMYETAMEKTLEILSRYGRRLTVLSFLRLVSSTDGVEILCYFYVAVRVLLFRNVTVAEAAVLFSAVIQFTSRLRRISNLLNDMQEKSRYVDSLRAFLDLECVTEGSDVCQDAFSCLEIKDLSFSYGEKSVLQNVNLKIRQGETVMIVGANGAGKSTLVKLLLRLYEPQEGDVLYNGKKASDFTVQSYRAHFSYMPQDFQIYDMSLEDNIYMGRTDRQAMTDIDEAVRFSTMNKWLPGTEKGLQSNVGRTFDAQGLELSGGQKQSVALARLRVKESDIYILDEPSSALDPVAEATLFRQFQEQTRGRTCIFISHRYAAAQYADRIILLDQGRVAETGTHRELMQKSGLYARMFETQASYYQEQKEQHSSEAVAG